MLYEKMIQTITGYIAAEMNLGSEKKDRIRFGLEILISTLISIIVSLGLAKILGLFNVVLIILLANGLMKLVGGGVHLKSVGECALFSALSLNIMAYLIIQLQELLYSKWPLFLFISAVYILISLVIWSPADVEEKPIKKERKRNFLKLLSLIISSLLLIIVWLSFYFFQARFIITNISIIFGMLFQSFTINPIAYKLLDVYYQTKSKLFLR